MNERRQHRSTLIPIVILVIGAVLMAGKIYADSEPGALPLAMVVVGLGWYAVARFRRRPHPQPQV